MSWERRTMSGGKSYSQWVEPVPRIPTFILNSIVYLYSDRLNAEGGVDAGGSGFLLGMPSERCQTAHHMYAVTNGHVIENGATVIRINLKYPSTGYTHTECFDLSKDKWIIHPKHDLAIYSFPNDLDTSLFNLTLIGTNVLMTREEFDRRDIGEGDDLFYVGRFMGHAGKFYNLPSVRFGNISMVPNEDEPIEYETENRRRSQVGFLVEARSRSGYSGSPVFFIQQHSIDDSRAVIADLDIRMIGVDWGHIPERVPLKDPNNYLHSQNWFVEVHSGMMGVVPSWYLEEFIRTAPVLIEQRSRDDECYLKDVSGRPDMAPPNGS